MVLEFQGVTTREVPEVEEEAIPSPQISIIEADEKYGKFVIEPLDPGFGITLGNPLRRVLYSSLQGTAVTWAKIEGVLHEYDTIPHVKEEVSEFLLNIKGIRLRSDVDRQGKLRLEVAGEGEVCAGDIMASSDFEIVNPELHLATLDSTDAKLSVELNVERGKGYVVAVRGDGQQIGVLPLDAVFTPIKKVNYHVEKTRVGQRSDFERLVLEVWTDGSVTPVEALQQAANTLSNQFFLVAHVDRVADDGGDGPSMTPIIPAEQYQIPVERLDLSSRTLNCLKRAGINKVGEVLEMSRTELLRIRNFGEKSYNELFGRLREMKLLPAELDKDENQNGAASSDEGAEETAAETKPETTVE
ncbi:MAG: DNA-directed RNA polymerase subunit alpha [Chloroflexi bacterium]|nr:DNA-directed RNA polymerase subunit alpha [Chloroflexota bacterium]